MHSPGPLAKASFALCSLLALASAQAAGISDDKVRIGVLSDMSGQYSDSGGRGSVEAAKMAVEDFGSKVLGKPSHRQVTTAATSAPDCWIHCTAKSPR